MAITKRDIERISGPYSTRKFEFIYSDFYPVKKGVAYYNVYTKDKKKKYRRVFIIEKLLEISSNIDNQ